MLSSADRAQ